MTPRRKGNGNGNGNGPGSTPERGARAHRSIDWAAARARLAALAAAADAAQAKLGPEQARAVLDARAEALARVPPRAPTAAEVLELVVFHLGDERYALETRHVRRVVRLHEPTPLPGAPEFVAGIVNLRGEILTVFDLRLLLGLASPEATAAAAADTGFLIVLGTEAEELGIIADSAREVRSIRRDAVLAPSAALDGPGRSWLLGVTDDALSVLDGAALLDDDRLVVNQGDEPGG